MISSPDDRRPPITPQLALRVAVMGGFALAQTRARAAIVRTDIASLPPYGNGTLPAGLTIFGRPWDEGPLFAFAYAYEQATHHRKPPPTTPPLK
jgi:Asp-tRNA(Asn)/Glu-tRNA(Gln) amidotransferase A subunit family amidase